MSAFNAQQTLQLLAPIKPNRVLADGKGHSHVSQQDITAHLIRVFGFGSFDTDIVKVELVYEQERTNQKGEFTGRWDVCYRSLLRLTIRDADGNEVCHYEDGSTATAQNQTRGDAHDLAYKSALSLAKKRAAINLGDQFGLSLYNKGQTDALVRGTLVLPAKPEDDEKPTGDVQEGVAQQVSLGNDEIDREHDGGEQHD
jgi:recombination DNA repair RAD52 pathway protein